MPRTNVIRWRDGAGWIVLSGGGDFATGETGDLEVEVLARMQAGDHIAYVWAGGDVETADQHLASLEDLGAPTGYLVDVLTEDDDTIRSQLSSAGLIIVGDGSDITNMRSGVLGAALDGISKAFEDGAIVMGIGRGAALFGSVVDGQQGVDWVQGAIIAPYYNQEGVPEKLTDLLLKQPEAYGLGITAGSGLALGPNGQIEALGDRQVTVKLGHSFR
jgi:hypothetical protein